MDIKLYREYRLKFYLNGRHYIIIDGKKGEIHPHTWEFALTILIQKKEFVEFTVFEECINGYLDKYQDTVLNDMEPFGAILPTLENMVDLFAKNFMALIHDVGGELLTVEGSEGPSRSYILDLREENESMDSVEDNSENILSEIIDTILDDIVE